MIVVLCTVPEEKAHELAKKIVEEKVAACVNVIPNLMSYYWWNGEIQKDAEILLMIKTLDDAFEKLKEVIINNHPYEVPEIVALPINKGNESYLSWIKDSVQL